MSTAVKFAEGSDNIIEGLALPFGGPFAGKDLDGESFGPDTDFAFDWFPEEGRPVIYEHGLEGAMKTALVGRQIERVAQDVGHWVKVQLDKRNRYYEAIAKMVREGKLAFSSGSLSHLVEVEDSGSIKTWPWVELSLTTTPANPDAAVYSVKSSDAIEHIAAVKSAVPTQIKSAVDAIEDGFTEQAHEGESESESLAERSARVTAELKEWVERVSARTESRSKEGRKVLSDPTVESVRGSYAALAEVIAIIDRPTVQEQAAATEAEYLRFEAAQLGVTPEE